MQSTLSTGLNKNEEHIKENCINTYVRQVTFKNNEKVHLNEDTAIPASKIPIRRYVRCNSLLYPTDIQICNFDLQFTIVRESSWSCSTSSILITPTEVNNNGLLTVVQSKLSTLNIQLVNTFDESTYSGCRLHIQQQQDARVKMLSCNYAFSWMMGIILSFKGNSQDTTLVLKNTSSNIDTISDPSQIDDQKHIISKQFFPLINGGINIINISSDELVTSQYVNGFKTATLASIPANNLKVSTHSLLNFSLPTKKQHQTQGNKSFHYAAKASRFDGWRPWPRRWPLTTNKLHNYRFPKLHFLIQLHITRPTILWSSRNTKTITTNSKLSSWHHGQHQGWWNKNQCTTVTEHKQHVAVESQIFWNGA